MGEVSKFIPMEGNGETANNTTGADIGNTGTTTTTTTGTVTNGTTTGTFTTNDTVTTAGTVGNGEVDTGNSTFKVCGTSNNLPAKPTLWSKIKSILTYEIKVELTPYQQKVENEVNEFLHKEITWQSVKNFFSKTFGRKNEETTNN